MLYFPERITKGDVPNVDFLHLYGPGSLHVLAGWYELFGNTLAAERTFGLVQHVAIIFGLFTLARPWGRAAATLVAAFAVFYVLTPIGLTAMAWNGGLALTLWCAVFAVRSTYVAGRSQLLARVAAGVLGGLALTYRPDLVLAVAVVLTWLIWTQRASWRAAAVGVVVGLTPLWAHLAIAGPRAAWQGMVVDPVVHLRSGRELPRPPSWDRLDGALQAIAESQPPWWHLPHVRASQAIFLWFLAMLAGTVGLLVLALLERRRGRRDGRSTVLLVVALVSVAILPQALQRPDSTHLTWVTCVSWPFAVVAVADIVQRRWPQTSMRSAAAAGAAFTLVLTYAADVAVHVPPLPAAHARRVRLGAGDLRDQPRRAQLLLRSPTRRPRQPAGHRRSGRPGSTQATGCSSARWICPARGTAMPSSTGCSRRWSRRRTSSRWIPASPTPKARDSPTISPPPTSSILTAFWAGWREPNSSMEFGSPEPNEVLAEQLLPVPPVPGRPRPPLLPLPLSVLIRVFAHPSATRTAGRETLGSGYIGTRRQSGGGQVPGNRHQRSQGRRNPDDPPAGPQRLDGGGGDGLGRCRQRRRLHPRRHLRADPPGPDDQDARSAAGQGIAEPLGEAVDAGLRRAVHVVGLAHPFAGDAGQARPGGRGPGDGTARPRPCRCSPPP